MKPSHSKEIAEAAERLEDEVGQIVVAPIHSTEYNPDKQVLDRRHLLIGSVELGESHHKPGSEWVLLRDNTSPTPDLYFERYNLGENKDLVLSYSHDGIAGNSDIERQYDRDELTADGIVSFVRQHFKKLEPREEEQEA